MVDPSYLRLDEPVHAKQCRYGPMVYLSTDQYIGKALDKYGEYSEGEVFLWSKIIQPGWNVLDIGANQGAHTVALAKLVGPTGKVGAFEPQRYLYHILCANLALNSLMNVHAYQIAVGKEHGAVRIPNIDYTQNNNFGAVSVGPLGEEVTLIKLDEGHFPHVDFIKIDAEGMEEDIIYGAETTIRNFWPILYVENDRDDKSESMIKCLWDFGYDLYWHTPFYFNRHNFFKETENIYGWTISVSMLCVPKSKHIIIPEGCKLIQSSKETWRDA